MLCLFFHVTYAALVLLVLQFFLSFKQNAAKLKNLQIFGCWHCECAPLRLTGVLKELSHEIEMCWWWYGWMEPYLEMNL